MECVAPLVRSATVRLEQADQRRLVNRRTAGVGDTAGGLALRGGSNGTHKHRAQHPTKPNAKLFKHIKRATFLKK